MLRTTKNRRCGYATSVLFCPYSFSEYPNRFLSFWTLSWSSGIPAATFCFSLRRSSHFVSLPRSLTISIWRTFPNSGRKRTISSSNLLLMIWSELVGMLEQKSAGNRRQIVAPHPSCYQRMRVWTKYYRPAASVKAANPQGFLKTVR